jgi:hypothetical protein
MIFGFYGKYDSSTTSKAKTLYKEGQNSNYAVQVHSELPQHPQRNNDQF